MGFVTVGGQLVHTGALPALSRPVFDPDEWEGCVVTQEGTWGGSGTLNAVGEMTFGRRRTPEEVASIKAARERRREDAIIAEADAIRARRLRDCCK